jgi:glycosyltransferase involved in cell wall biosynthesis
VVCNLLRDEFRAPPGWAIRSRRRAINLSDPNVRLTVAICTWNRANLLGQALSRMTQLTLPKDLDWELLVVNNNCTDETDHVIAGFAGTVPIRRLFQPNPGKSHALNLAVSEARGDYILWTDDDVLVDPKWVAAYLAAIAQWPEAVFFGGPVRPWFVKPPPEWLQRAWSRVGGVYAVRDLGDTPEKFKGGDHVPYGANFLIRTREQRQFPYDIRVGPQPGSAVRGEETRVIRAMLAAGCEGRWVPDAIVQHYVPPERMTIAYVRNWWIGEGRGQALTAEPWRGPTFLGKPRYLWRALSLAWIRYVGGRLRRRPDLWIRDLIDYSVALGHLRGFRTNVHS